MDVPIIWENEDDIEYPQDEYGCYQSAPNAEYEKSDAKSCFEMVEIPDGMLPEAAILQEPLHNRSEMVVPEVKSGPLQIIRVVHDKQDLGFVDKVHVTESHVLELCNRLAPPSVDTRGEVCRINYQSLNKLSLPTLGMYGDKSMMIKALGNLGAVDEFTLSKMKNEEFEAGLYVVPMGNAIVVFYWHQGPVLEDAARKNISCNFIRYLVELCDRVCIFVEEEKLRDALASSSVKNDRKYRRTRRLRVEQVQNSSNDVSISPGFSLDIKNSIPVELPDKVQLSSPVQNFLFSEGYHHCAFLTPHFKTPAVYMQSGMIKCPVNELPDKLKGLMRSYILDFSNLGNEDFVTFLKNSGFEEFKSYQEINKSFKLRTEEVDRKFDAASRVTEIKNKILDAFTNILPEVSSLFKYLLEHSKKDLTEGSSVIPSNADHIDILVKELLSILCPAGRKLIFVGSEIKFKPIKGSLVTYVVEPCEGSIGLVSMGKKFKLEESEAYFSKEGAERKGFIAPGETITLHLGKKQEKGVVIEVDTTKDVVKRWINEQLVPSSLLKSEKNCRFLCYLISICEKYCNFIQQHKSESKKYPAEDIVLLLSPCDVASESEDSVRKCSLIKAFLTEGDVNKVLVEAESENDSNSNTEFDFSCWRTEFRQIELDTKASLINNFPLWNQICSDLCLHVKDLFKNNLLLMLRKDLLPEIEKRVKEEKEILKKNLEEAFIAEKTKFLKQAKAKLYTKNGSRHVHVQSHSLRKRFVFPDEVHMTAEVETTEKASIKWMINELAPKKKDLDELCLSSMHCITPICSSPQESLAVDFEVEALKKVVYLKSGQVILFVYNNRQESALNVYVVPKAGCLPNRQNPTYRWRRGWDLIAFEESTRFVALYDDNKSVVKIYKFGENFRHVTFTGVEVVLDVFTGSCKLKYMICIPGKQELLLVDDSNRIRVVEVHHQPLMKPKYIELDADYITGCISPDGSFLLLLQRRACVPLEPEVSQTESELSSEKHSLVKQDTLSAAEIQVYLLGDSMCFLKSISLDIPIESTTDLQLKLVHFGEQNQLVVYSNSNPGKLSSYVLKMTSATEEMKFQELSNYTSNGESLGKHGIDQSSLKSCSTLDFIYHIYEKFAVVPALCEGIETKQNFSVILKPTCDLSGEEGNVTCQRYLKNLIKRIEKEKGKDFTMSSIAFDVHPFSSWDTFREIDIILAQAETEHMGAWIQKLVCLVPIQICRAHNNGIQPLLNGLQIPANVAYADSISLANLLRFGMYDTILSQWKGEIKVVSSMGKQSSGKSFLLNHLSGSLLDVAGGRCTDGVWMTIRIESKCLYVLLDFEGLGSFERTEQEDMLLSVLNAAISNLTIFNKKDFHLDKETEILFQRFQNGVNLIKSDKKLFNGLFYIAIKDVDASDVEELKDEFHMKLAQICGKSKENFLTKMYMAEVEIDAMPPFTRQEYYNESLIYIAETVKRLKFSYTSGRVFLRDLKLVISQIAAKDWTAVDMKRIAMKVDILRKNMASALKSGCLANGEALIIFDTEEEVADLPLELAGVETQLMDKGLMLAPFEETMGREKLLEDLRLQFEQMLERGGKKCDEWHVKFEEFLAALAKRRNLRLHYWIHSNTSEFSDDNEVQKLQLETNLALAEITQGLSVCGSKCSICFWRCVLVKGHLSSHSCMSSHSCSESCTFCIQLNGKVEECQGLAGHEGDHDCKRKNHTCEKTCHLYEKSSNCTRSCSLKVGHEGAHMCNSPQHVCKVKCSLSGCQNPCIIEIERGDHEQHACHERYCPKECIMPGCRRTCGYKDHFHQLKSDEHLCGSEHPCPEKCQEEGVCEIFTELLREIRFFQGKRGSFEYEHVSEQNGLRKDCCITIPAFKKSHGGKHFHSMNPDAVHYCNIRCRACGYFCQRPINHSGLHDTVHGNMRNVNFVSENEEINLADRKYTWGESGMAEMCNMHCRTQGRGHIHLIHCPGKDKYCTSFVYDGARHETRKYGPDENVAKDELTHETYWQMMRFEDPCTEDDQKEFALCNHLCSSEDHMEEDGTSKKSYCIKKLWHEPVTTNAASSSTSYTTSDGHSFNCNHYRNALYHIIFVIDKSGSMADTDMRPSKKKFANRHNCRLGCVYEAISRFITTRRRFTKGDALSVILFDNAATLALELQELKDEAVDELLRYFPNGLTSYHKGLLLAEEVVARGTMNSKFRNMKPVIIFLSDGHNCDKADPAYYVNKLKLSDPRTTLHTVMFGLEPKSFLPSFFSSSKTASETLKKMASAGKGTFRHDIDELQLARGFENLATSLKPSISALM